MCDVVACRWNRAEAEIAQIGGFEAVQSRLRVFHHPWHGRCNRWLAPSLDRQAGLNLSEVSTTDWDKLKTVTKKLTVMNGGKLQRIGFDPKVPEFFGKRVEDEFSFQGLARPRH